MGLDQFIFKRPAGRTEVATFRKHSDLQGYFEDIDYDLMSNGGFINITAEMCEDIIARSKYTVDFLEKYRHLSKAEDDCCLCLRKLPKDRAMLYDDSKGFTKTEGFFYGDSTLDDHKRTVEVFTEILAAKNSRDEDTVAEVYEYSCWW